MPSQAPIPSIAAERCEPEEIARGLTEAQRDKLLNGFFPMLGWANVSVNGHPTHIPELAAMGLLERATDINGKPHFCFFRATPLGLAVRDYLTKEKPHGL